MTVHWLGGAVATLLGVLVYRDLKNMRQNISNSKVPAAMIDSDDDLKAPLYVYAYGTPSCVDVKLLEVVKWFVTTAVLHNDVVPRLSPTTCWGLLKHLLHIHETWVKTHFPDDMKAYTDRAKTAWAPKWRGAFTLPNASSRIKFNNIVEIKFNSERKRCYLSKRRAKTMRALAKIVIQPVTGHLRTESEVT
jgi:hypothetical protein